MNKTQYAVFEKVPAHSNKPDSVILAPYNTKEEAQFDRVKYGYDTDNYYVDVYDSDVEKYINDLIKKTKKIPYNNEFNGESNIDKSIIMTMRQSGKTSMTQIFNEVFCKD